MEKAQEGILGIGMALALVLGGLLVHWDNQRDPGECPRHHYANPSRGREEAMREHTQLMRSYQDRERARALLKELIPHLKRGTPI